MRLGSTILDRADIKHFLQKAKVPLDSTLDSGIFFIRVKQNLTMSVCKFQCTQMIFANMNTFNFKESWEDPTYHIFINLYIYNSLIMLDGSL